MQFVFVPRLGETVVQEIALEDLKREAPAALEACHLLVGVTPRLLVAALGAAGSRDVTVTVNPAKS